MSTSIGPVETEVLADPACSFWLRARIGESSTRDPLDALRDAETLVAVLAERWERVAAAVASELNAAER